MSAMATIIRNNFTLPTLLLTGACAQSLITLILPFRYAFLPAFTFLIGQVVYTTIMSLGYVKNPYMRNVNVGKYTAQIPNADGSISQKASDKNVVVFMIGSTSHRYIFRYVLPDIGNTILKNWQRPRRLRPQLPRIRRLFPRHVSRNRSQSCEMGL